VGHTGPITGSLYLYLYLHSDLKSGIAKYYSGDEIKKNEMGGACSMYGRQDRCTKGLGGGDVTERGHLEDNRLNLHEVKWGGMDWIYLAQDRDRW